MAELQVLAGTGGVALRAQRVLHLLNLQFQGIERSEDLLHAVVVVLVVGVHSRVVHLAGVDVPTISALHGGLHGERVDDVAGWSLKRWTGECREEMTQLKRIPSVWNVDLQELQEVQVFRSLLLDQFDPRHDKKKSKKLTNLFLNWFLLLIIDPTLTDDPLAPLGPGGPYTHTHR